MPRIATAPHRHDLGNRAILALVLCLFSATSLFFLFRPWLSETWASPGSQVLYLLGVAGMLLMLVPFFFSLAKRSSYGERPPTWFVVHVVASTLGLWLLLLHSAGNFGRPPALVLLGGAFLVLQGTWARIYCSHRTARTFGTRFSSILGPIEIDKTRLRRLIDEKRTILAQLDPGRAEATFSPTLGHWLRHPVYSFAYARRARIEGRMIADAVAAPAIRPLWRRLHIAVAVLFVLGAVAHIATVTFFAGYVADGGEIDWWHLADWGA